MKKNNLIISFCIIVSGLLHTQNIAFAQDNLSVMANNMANLSDPNAQPPDQPGVITGLNVVCSGQSGVEYSISSVTDADSYIWKVPAGATITAGNGSTTITVTFGSIGGNIIVRGTNAECGAGKSTSFAVSVIPSPTITLGTVIPIYSDSTSFNLPYSATTADKYSIAAGTPSLSGFIPVSNTDLPLPPSSITVTVPGGHMTPDNYQFNITITNTTTGCTSTYPFIVSILGTCPGFPTVTDVDGNVYNTVQIGTQCWMQENLKTTKYNNNTGIPNVTIGSDWEGLTTPAYCWYDNDISNKVPFGALYNGYAVYTGNLCPSGWKVPSDADWTTLFTYLGGTNVAGGHMKETGTNHWSGPNAADNSSGFTALPGGSRSCETEDFPPLPHVIHYGQFCFKDYAFFYSSSSTSYSSYIFIESSYVNINSGGGSKWPGYSVRCVKN
jgi:uncharacterized protein (TIGR02145 family)